MPKTVDFHGTPINLPGFGAMGMSMAYGATDDEASRKTLQTAIDIGCTFWNTADMYGQGANEKLLGSVLAQGDNRSRVFLVTKFGFTWKEGVAGFGLDGSKKHAEESIDASIERLGTKPDAWALHRVDKKVGIEESVSAMEAARRAGKCKFIGLSECSVETLRRASAVAKIHFVEIEYSPWTLDIETNGLLAAAAELGVIVLAYSPLGRGFLTGRFQSAADFKADAKDNRANYPRFQDDVFEHNFKLVQELQEFASKKGCTPAQLTLAWLMAQGPAAVVPIPGTKSEKYLIENFASADISLDQTELTQLRKIIDGNPAMGDRYVPAMQAMLDT